MFVKESPAGPTSVALTNQAQESRLTDRAGRPHQAAQLQVVTGLSVLGGEQAVHADQQSLQPEVQLQAGPGHQYEGVRHHVDSGEHPGDKADFYKLGNNSSDLRPDGVLTVVSPHILHLVILQLDGGLEPVSLLHDGGFVAQNHDRVLVLWK